jgi:hypothetical protein
MRLIGQIHITVRGDVVTRNPSAWEKLKLGFGAHVNLETGEMKNGIEATTIVDAARRAVGRLGVSNALSLVIDDTIVFQDTDGKPDDLPDLVLALSEHSSIFGRGFRELRFAAEHQEAGLHLIIETRARTRHKKDEPAAIVSVGGRILVLEPHKNETAEQYRTRVEPLTRDSTLFETARLSFQSFVQRLESSLRAELPDADVVERKAEARLVRSPDRAGAIQERPSEHPLAPGYDPYLIYRPSPMGMMLDAMLFASFMSMLMPPQVMLVSPMGATIAPMPDVHDHPELASEHHAAQADESLMGAGSEEGSHTGDGNDGVWGDDYGQAGGADDSAGGWDAGGGDFGDGGGFD